MFNIWCRFCNFTYKEHSKFTTEGFKIKLKYVVIVVTIVMNFNLQFFLGVYVLASNQTSIRMLNKKGSFKTKKEKDIKSLTNFI